MTRAHHTSVRHKARASASRPRSAASSSPPNQPPRKDTRGATGHDDGAAAPTHPGPTRNAPRIAGAVTLCGLLLSTLDPGVVLELATRAAVYGAEVLLAIRRSAQRAAEHNHPPVAAHAHRGAGSPRRRRRVSRAPRR